MYVYNINAMYIIKCIMCVDKRKFKHVFIFAVCVFVNDVISAYITS